MIIVLRSPSRALIGGVTTDANTKPAPVITVELVGTVKIVAIHQDRRDCDDAVDEPVGSDGAQTEARRALAAQMVHRLHETCDDVARSGGRREVVGPELPAGDGQRQHSADDKACRGDEKQDRIRAIVRHRMAQDQP